ncbi:MAG: hypothetical protein ACLTQI_07630 [Slackia sp.]
MVYLPRTQGVSSTELRAERMKPVTVGCIGSGYLTDRFIDECTHVAGIDVTNIWPKPESTGIPVAESLDAMLDAVVAVYISASSKSTASTSRRSCAPIATASESPLFLNPKDMTSSTLADDQ